MLVYFFSFFGKRVNKKYIYPKVAIIMSLYNEEKNIERKVESLLQLDYPKEQIEVIIGSDGSTDRTNEMLSKYKSDSVKVYIKSERGGKPNMLNRLVSMATGELLVFTDARQRIEKGALKELVANFNDEKVGCVSSELHFEDESSKSGKGVGFYWKYEKFIRESESRIGSMLGATGALYAIRRKLFSEIPSDIILDDVYLPFEAIRAGYRAVFEPEAKIYDTVPETAKDEFNRKVRTHAGNFQVFRYFKDLFIPFKSPIAIQFFSHKLLRFVVPYLLVTLFISNLFILDGWFYVFSFWSQILFYACALMAIFFKYPNKLFDIPHMFCVMNIAAVVGLARYLGRKHSVVWEKAKIQGIEDSV